MKHRGFPASFQKITSLPDAHYSQSRNNFKSHMYQDATDLFGDVVITDYDLYLWVAAVSPRWLTPERSYRNYLRTYDVAGKVRFAKLRGTFDDTVNDVYRPWHERLALDIIT